MESFAESIGSFGSSVFRLCLVAFVVLNAAGAITVFLTRNRQIVNRWTSRFVAANLLLVGAGAGVPLMAQALKLVVKTVAVTESPGIRIKGK